MNLSNVMVEVAERLDTITGLRVAAQPGQKVQPPGAIVTYPESFTFDATCGRGADRAKIHVFVLVGRATARTAREEMGEFTDGAGDRSVKAVLESGTYTSFHTIRVEGGEIDTVKEGDVDYLACDFTLDIFGAGSA